MTNNIDKKLKELQLRKLELDIEYLTIKLKEKQCFGFNRR